MERITARQYETVELCFKGKEPTGSHVTVDLTAAFSRDGETVRVKGFYAGDGAYKVRFLPERSGDYTYTVTGEAIAESVTGTLEVLPTDGSHHGPVRADGTHLRHADGTLFHSFGTTVYALAHQSEALIDETMRTLADAPFNKIRMCLFPKHYHYNYNEPQDYAFFPKQGVAQKDFTNIQDSRFYLSDEPRDDYWDVHHPNFAFWDRFEARLKQLQEMGIEVDLILFHPYDRWGFANLSMEDNLTYLDYLLRRFSAFPGIWWSLANEYDICFNRSNEDWCAIEAFVSENDPYHHMLGNHNCFAIWDAGREHITHVSWQTPQHFRVAELMKRHGKPVMIDECRYEGTLPEFWGNLSGQDMTRAFWRVTVQGGYCTHGETFYPGTELGDKATETGEEEVVWWAKGGRLNGESPARIAFLRKLVEELPDALEPLEREAHLAIGMADDEVQKLSAAYPTILRLFAEDQLSMGQRERDFAFAAAYEYNGHCGDDAFLWYLDDQSAACKIVELPKDNTYRVEVIDTWEMKRETVLESASGATQVNLPGKPFMAILAVKNQ